MSSFLRGLKQMPWWLWLLIGFVLLLPLSSHLAETDPETGTTEASATDADRESPAGSISSAELVEFDDTVLELDPEQTLVTKIEQADGSDLVVDVTVGNGFILVDQTQQGEVAIAMRDRLANICECSPYLKFETEGGQRLVEIGRGQPKYK
ncbi:hypothetical protein Lepto7375DRAFT_1825 [Leptolyngbya sp. PCC 7375]|nr:hypothetical protein Lepto7375DRAFT_1825 [Leptolyngbya sp. PCC 7375]